MLKSLLLFLVSAVVSNLLLRQFSNVAKGSANLGLFTKEELRRYNGIDRPELYLAILGKVFDVSPGAKHYGPGETYHIFVGRDNSKGFVTGEAHEQGTSEDVLSFGHDELRSLKHWVKFYKKQYIKKGKLIGRFYDERGKLTAYGKQVRLSMTEAELARVDEDNRKLEFPPCNIEWDANKGSRVWCTNRSGGIERSWIGVPRQLYEVGAESYRCACIGESNKHLGTVKEYEGCPPDSSSCYVV